MAEGFARYFGGSSIAVKTASDDTTMPHPYCQWAMNEAGIDISVHSPGILKDQDLTLFDRVVKIGSDAGEDFPSLPPGLAVEEWGISDPTSLRARPHDLIKAYRVVRNDIEGRVKDLLAGLLPG
jgi:arsenate reductase